MKNCVLSCPTPKDFNYAELLHVEYFVMLYLKNILSPLILVLHIIKIFNCDDNWQSNVRKHVLHVRVFVNLYLTRKLLLLVDLGLK